MGERWAEAGARCSVQDHHGAEPRARRLWRTASARSLKGEGSSEEGEEGEEGEHGPGPEGQGRPVIPPPTPSVTSAVGADPINSSGRWASVSCQRAVRFVAVAVTREKWWCLMLIFCCNAYTLFS